MPTIQYEKTVIYKIQCKNLGQNIALFGHTTNLQKTKYKFKHNCKIGAKDTITTTILENGGWENFDWIVVEHFDTCRSKYEADTRVSSIKDALITHKLLTNAPKHAVVNNEKGKYTCQHCSRQFDRRFNMERHMNKFCKKQEQKELKIMQDKIEMQEKEIEKLKERLTTNITNNITNNSTINNNNIQNNQQNNTIVIELGNEDMDFLTLKQKVQILNKKYNSLDALIEYMHCNPKYPQFKCIEIPSLSKSHCNYYSKKHGKFIKWKTKDAIEKLVDNRMEDIQSFLEIAQEKGEPISQLTETAVKGLIDKMDSDAKYKKEKCEKIKIDIHNNII